MFAAAWVLEKSWLSCEDLFRPSVVLVVEFLPSYVLVATNKRTDWLVVA